jgi:hypothetical protein
MPHLTQLCSLDLTSINHHLSPHSKHRAVGSSKAAVKQANNETLGWLCGELQRDERELVMKSTFKYTSSLRIRTHDIASQSSTL